MASDRRSFLLTSMWGMACVGCSLSGASPSTVSPDGWNALKKNFFAPDGRIIDTGNGGISHSEGQGYGMVLAAMAGDRTAFDAMSGWTDQVLRRNDVALYSWRFDPALAQPVADPNNATDGDILIAWGLLIADKRWPGSNYGERSARIRRAIRANLVVERQGFSVLLPGLVGFEEAERTTLNPSYYVWPALDAFQSVDGEDDWRGLIDDGESILHQSRFGPLSLTTDWIDLLPEGKIVPAAARPPRFGFDAVRVPLYLVLSGRTALADDCARFWLSYLDAARQLPAWVNVETGETAPYGLSNGGLAVVQRVTGRQITTPDILKSGDYYSVVLAALAGLPKLS